MPGKSRVLMIGYVWPEPRSSAAGVRDQALIEIFREAAYEVTFASTARVNEYANSLNKLGVATLPIAANDPAFDRQVTELAPDIVIFDRFVHEEQFGWRVRAACPGALRVLDTQDLHFLRKARGEWTKAGVALAEVCARRPERAADACLRELASIHRSDLTLLCSDFERDLLVADFGVSASQLELASFFYPNAATGEVSGPGFSERAGFVTVGNFRHAPNLDALHWLHAELWPRILREAPGARVEIYGAYPSREVMALSDPRNGFIVRGPELGDIVPVLARFRVNLAPLRFGAGIKGKIAEGWRAGTPAVTTPIGAEGMSSPALPFGGAIGTSVEALAEHALRLHRDPAEWIQASACGRALIRGRFAREQNAPALLGALERARAGLAERRADNLVGQLLWQQGLRSTEYFSRWIEAKNRLKELGTADSRA